MTAVCLCDFRDGKIPNCLSVMILLSGCGYLFMTGGIVSAGKALAACCLVILAFYPLFWLRMMGAGDIKVISAIPAFLSSREWFQVVGCAFVLAGIWSVYSMVRRKALKERFACFFSYVQGLLETGMRTPYSSLEADSWEVLRIGPFLWAGMTVFLMRGGIG